ncbi:MAG: hypothetical protein WAM76_19335, partial [Pseudolabrys sp.]
MSAFEGKADAVRLSARFVPSVFHDRNDHLIRVFPPKPDRHGTKSEIACTQKIFGHWKKNELTTACSATLSARNSKPPT